MPANELDDQQLLALLAKDSDRAVKLLYEKYHRSLSQAAHRILPDAHAAEDIVQEVFLELWRKHRRLNIDRSLGAYLRRSVINRSLNYLRDRKPEAREDVALDDRHPAGLDHPAQRLSAEELQAQIDRAIDALPERCRLVFILSRFEDMTYREIAELLAISPKTVENQMVKALAQLRQALKPFLLSAIWLLVSLFG